MKFEKKDLGFILKWLEIVILYFVVVNIANLLPGILRPGAANFILPKLTFQILPLATAIIFLKINFPNIVKTLSFRNRSVSLKIIISLTAVQLFSLILLLSQDKPLMGDMIIYNAFESTISAPIVEELLFHVILLNFLVCKVKNRWIPIVITGIVFAVFHSYNLYGSSFVLFYFTFLSMIYLATDNIFLVLALHFIQNLKFLIALHLINLGIQIFVSDIVIYSMGIFALLIYLGILKYIVTTIRKTGKLIQYRSNDIVLKLYDRMINTERREV